MADTIDSNQTHIFTVSTGMFGKYGINVNQTKEQIVRYELHNLSRVKRKSAFEHAQKFTDSDHPARPQSITSRKHTYIILTPLNPTSIYSKMGFTGIYIIFLISAQKHSGLSRNVKNIRIFIWKLSVFSGDFVRVEVLRPSQPNGVMSSAVSLPNHTFTGQA